MLEALGYFGWFLIVAMVVLEVVGTFRDLKYHRKELALLEKATFAVLCNKKKEGYDEKGCVTDGYRGEFLH